jgi:UDP-N-acetylmuramoyl-tripeptide--D-alanyl-D-alanine ligase
MIWTAEELCHVLKLNLSKCNAHFGRLQINSKEVKDGELFVALKGSRDGHEFVQDAIGNGAGAVLVSQYVHGVDQNKVIKVDDTMEAIIRLAEYKRSTSNALFMAVTGSVGKKNFSKFEIIYQKSVWMMLN